MLLPELPVIGKGVTYVSVDQLRLFLSYEFAETSCLACQTLGNSRLNVPHMLLVLALPGADYHLHIQIAKRLIKKFHDYVSLAFETPRGMHLRFSLRKTYHH